MNHRIAMLAFAAVVAVHGSADAKTESFDYYANIEWLLSQRFSDGVFDSCVASKTRREGNQVLAVGRSFSGEDFMLLHGVQELLPAGSSKASGKLTLSNGIPHAFANLDVQDEPGEPGQKYITVYLPEAFVDRIASAGSVTFQFKDSKSTHGLAGSRDIVKKLDECLESGLARLMPRRLPPIAPPAGWSFAKAADETGRSIAIALPGPMDGPSGQMLHMAYVENARGLYDIRFRAEADALVKGLDPLQARRLPTEVRLGFARAFTAMLLQDGGNFDLVDVRPEELARLDLAGPLSILSLDPAAPARITVPFTAGAALGAKTITDARTLPPLTLASLAGTYYVRGRNPDGKAYTGIAEMEMNGEILRIDWQWRSGKSDTAQASLVSDILTAAVEGLPDPVFYRIGKDGVWRGFWDKGRAVEWMIPAPPGDNPLAADESEVTSSLDPAADPAPADN